MSEGNGASPVLLKLGGALLTDKAGHEAVRHDVVARVAAELAAWFDGGRPLVVAHGSGSFAHRAAARAGFPAAFSPAAFAAVAASAARLHRVVVDALVGAGLPAVGVPGGAVAALDDGRVAAVRSDLVGDLVAAGLVPVTYGDAALDRRRGGGIASTEPILVALAAPLGVGRLVFATDVDGVFDRDPAAHADARCFDRLTPGETPWATGAAGARAGVTDVTGGMDAKLAAAFEAVVQRPGVTVRIVSGLRPGALAAALDGRADAGGTLIARRDASG